MMTNERAAQLLIGLRSEAGSSLTDEENEALDRAIYALGEIDGLRRALSGVAYRLMEPRR